MSKYVKNWNILDTVINLIEIFAVRIKHRIHEETEPAVEEILDSKKVIEIRWGDISHISNKGRRLPVPSSNFYNLISSILFTWLYYTVKFQKSQLFSEFLF